MIKYYHVDGIHHDEVYESDGDDVVNDYVTRIMMVLFFYCGNKGDDDDGGVVVHLNTSEAIWHSPPFSIC